MTEEATQSSDSNTICRETIEKLLASTFRQTPGGSIHRFMFGPPGAPIWDRRMGVEIQYDRRRLLECAMYVRTHGPAHVSSLPVEEISSRLTNFLSENFGHIGLFPILRVTCSFADAVAPEIKERLAALIADSEIFKLPVVVNVYPLVPVQVRDPFDGGAFFLIDPPTLGTKVPDADLDPEHFPPLKSFKGIKQRPGAWLGVRAATNHAAQKVRAAVIGALALVPHRLERYSFTGRKVFGGRISFHNGYSFNFGDSHTPALSDDIIIETADHRWLEVLGRKLASHSGLDRRHVNALEYFYKSWAPDRTKRFPTLFSALDAIYGDPEAHTLSVISAVGLVPGLSFDEKRLRRMLKLRAAVLHGGAPEVCEAAYYHMYLSEYGIDPMHDMELITARCLQREVFDGLLQEHTHTYAELIKGKTGLVV